jgi:hypothetical protein
MTRILFFIESIARGLYLFVAVGILLSAWQIFASRSQLRVAEFELERELARKKQAGAITRTLFLVELLLAIFAIATVIAPTVRDDLTTLLVSGPAVNPTNVPFYTSTPGGDGSISGSSSDSITNLMLTVTAMAQSEAGGPQIVVTPTISPTPVGTINPDVPAALGCESPEAQLQVPANGQVIFDAIEVRGSASAPNFALYKFELSGPSTGNAFTPVDGDKVQPVKELGILGQLSLNGFQPGLYKFRLAVFDNTTALRASCTVTVEVRERPPTATPPGG